MKNLLLLLLLSSPALAKPATGSTASIDRVLLTVDGHAVWHSQLEELYERAQLKDPTFEQTQQMIDSLIDAALVDNAATKLHVEASDADVDSAIGMIKQQNNIDDAGLAKALADQHMTLETYRIEIKRQLRVSRVFNGDFAARVQITEDEIRKTYDAVKKMDPSMGTYDKEHDKMRSYVFEQKSAELQAEWFKKAKAAAHIEKR